MDKTHKEQEALSGTLARYESTAVEDRDEADFTEVLSRSSKVFVRREEFSGPLPHPVILNQYEQICPGAADRILTMSESSLKHYQEMETRNSTRSDRLVSVVSWSTILGTIFAGLIGIGGLIGGIYLVASGATKEGLSTIFGPLAALVGVYLYNQRTRKPARDSEPPEDRLASSQPSAAADGAEPTED